MAWQRVAVLGSLALRPSHLKIVGCCFLALCLHSMARGGCSPKACKEVPPGCAEGRLQHMRHWGRRELKACFKFKEGLLQPRHVFLPRHKCCSI